MTSSFEHRGLFIDREEWLMLPEGYDPNEDKGRAAVELFLGREEPPTMLSLVPMAEGRYAARAVWGHE